MNNPEKLTHSLIGRKYDLGIKVINWLTRIIDVGRCLRKAHVMNEIALNNELIWLVVVFRKK